MPTLTDEQKAKYLKDPSHCPFCGSDNILCAFSHNGDTPSNQEIEAHCDDCYEEWVEVYVLQYIKDAEASDPPPGI